MYTSAAGAAAERRREYGKNKTSRQMEERRRRSKRVVIVMVAVRTVLGMIANLKIIKIFLISSTARYATLVNNII